jgi:hypothetical protein
MTMPSEERMKVLKMLEEGKIKADEAARLLEAVGDEPSSAENRAPGASTSRGRMLNIRVFKPGAETPRVKVQVPVSLARWALKFIPGHAKAEVNGKEFDLDEISSWLDGVPGDVITVNDEEAGERVEISVK